MLATRQVVRRAGPRERGHAGAAVAPTAYLAGRGAATFAMGSGAS
jgi:hypothetical protein